MSESMTVIGVFSERNCENVKVPTKGQDLPEENG